MIVTITVKVNPEDSNDALSLPTQYKLYRDYIEEMVEKGVFGPKEVIELRFLIDTKFKTKPIKVIDHVSNPGPEDSPNHAQDPELVGGLEVSEEVSPPDPNRDQVDETPMALDRSERRKVEELIKGASLDSLYLKVEVLDALDELTSEQSDMLDLYKKKIMELEAGT